MHLDRPLPHGLPMDSCGPVGRQLGFEKENKTFLVQGPLSLHRLKDYKMGHPGWIHHHTTKTAIGEVGQLS